MIDSVDDDTVAWTEPVRPVIEDQIDAALEDHVEVHASVWWIAVLVRAGNSMRCQLGDTAHVVTFPDGGPGLVLLKKRPTDKKKHGSFIIQVPNLSAAQTLAIANGAKEQRKFAGNPGGQAAKSIDFLDPWGNQVEILQIG